MHDRIERSDQDLGVQEETTLGQALRIAGLARIRPQPRTFRLVRLVDTSGVSGIGEVAEGCEFSDGTVVLRWRGPYPTTTVFDCLDDLVRVHGHGGATRVRFNDRDE